VIYRVETGQINEVNKTEVEYKPDDGTKEEGIRIVGDEVGIRRMRNESLVNGVQYPHTYDLKKRA